MAIQAEPIGGRRAGLSCPPAGSRRLVRPPAARSAAMCVVGSDDELGQSQGRIVASGPGSGQRLGLAVDEIIHHDEVAASVFTASKLDVTAGDPHEEDPFARVEGDPQE
jgi:hypothetical protein